MMGTPENARRNILCAFCKVEFFPSDNGWSRYRKNKPTYCSRACVKSKQAAEAHARNPDQPCTTCGVPFMLSPSQRDKIKTRPDTGLYCSTECLHKSRVVNFQKRRESGKLPVWGTPAQIASAKKLGEYSLANKRFGPAHPMWKGGKHSNKAKTERQMQWEQIKAFRNSAPKSLPCIACGEDTTLSPTQRQKWYNKGDATRICCSPCFSARSEKRNVYRAIQPRHARLKASGYYDDTACGTCQKIFTPSSEQRTHRVKYPKSHHYCSEACVSIFRQQCLAEYRDINGVMKGPTHPSWKTGWHSKEMQQAKSLVHNIKKSIKEGARV